MKINRIKKACYGCGRFDRSIPRGDSYKCFSNQCPVKSLSRIKLNALVKDFKERLKK
jgi:hypothetical protein